MSLAHSWGWSIISPFAVAIGEILRKPFTSLEISFFPSLITCNGILLKPQDLPCQGSPLTVPSKAGSSLKKDLTWILKPLWRSGVLIAAVWRSATSRTSSNVPSSAPAHFSAGVMSKTGPWCTRYSTWSSSEARKCDTSHCPYHKKLFAAGNLATSNFQRTGVLPFMLGLVRLDAGREHNTLKVISWAWRHVCLIRLSRARGV